MKNWGYKFTYIFKWTISKYKKLIIMWFSILGLFLTGNELLQFFFKSSIIEQYIRLYPIQILLFTLIIAFVLVKQPLKKTFCLQDSDIKLTLKVRDILKEEEAIVIPTNTTFDTKMDDEFISVKSVQGQFQEKYFKGNLSTLDNLIEKSLEGVSYIQLERQHSKNKKYPIGTVSKVCVSGKHVYLLAVADINTYGKPEGASFSKIQEALEGLWSTLNNKGHVENISIPILGTGRAGIKEPREKVIREIIFSFIACCRSTKLTENFSICIHPTDLRDANFKLETLYEFLDYMCKFGLANSNHQSEGVGIK